MFISQSAVRTDQRGPRLPTSEADRLFLVHTHNLGCKFLCAPLSLSGHNYWPEQLLCRLRYSEVLNFALIYMVTVPCSQAIETNDNG